MAGLKSSVSHLVTPSGPPPKLIFDQLEPRMLMSADPVVIDLSALHPVQPTNDVVVRLLNQVVTTGNQTTNIERVEAVDANNPANVLSSQVVHRQQCDGDRRRRHCRSVRIAAPARSG